MRSASIERIDEDHANPRKAWVEMGSPTYPDHGQIQTLIEASKLRLETLE